MQRPANMSYVSVSYLCPWFRDVGSAYLSMVLPEVQQEQSKQGGQYRIGTHSLLLELPLEEASILRPGKIIQ